MSLTAAQPAHDPRPASSPPTVAGAGQAAGGRVATTGDDLGPLVWRGLFFTIFTLGVYRFWYRTDLRRWYWRNTVVGGDGFAYRGTPRELFIGFLVALAVTLPLYFAGALAALFVASETTTNFISLVGLLVLAGLAQYGAFRARRFRLTRTVWRGLRFDQKGSAWRYAGMSLLWFLATVVTLGLTLPLLRRSLEAMKVRNTRFGTAEGRFDSPIGGLILRWLPAWFGAAVALGAAGFIMYGLLESATPDDSQEIGMAFAVALLALLAGMAALALVWPFYRAAEFRAFTGGSGIGPVTFRSDLAASGIYGIYMRFALVMLSLGLAAVGVGYLMLDTVMSAVPYFGGAGMGVGVIVLALAYLGGVYVFMAMKELVINRGFWRRAAESVTVMGLDQVEAVAATAVEGDSGAGEGLADALDFGGV